jgi:hypothetical protein
VNRKDDCDERGGCSLRLRRGRAVLRAADLQRFLPAVLLLVFAAGALAQDRVVHIEDIDPLPYPPEIPATGFETEVYDSSTKARPTLLWADRRLFLFYKDETTGRIFHRFKQPDGVWSQPAEVPDCVTGGAPSVCYWREYFFIAYTGGNTGHIYVNTMHLRSGAWTGAVKLAQGKAASQPAIQILDDWLYVVYRGTDNKLYSQRMEYLPRERKM